jgi:hypothetical protein
VDTFVVGQQIEHNDLPGFRMEILETASCEQDAARPESHHRYRITDPEGQQDWLCAYDVHAV